MCKLMASPGFLIQATIEYNGQIYKTNPIKIERDFYVQSEENKIEFVRLI